MRFYSLKTFLNQFPIFSSLLTNSLSFRLKLYSYIHSTWHFLLKGHLVRSFHILSFLRHYSHNKSFLGLQVGGGRHLILSPNWINGDLIAGDIYLDARKKLPFPDNSIDFIFAEQFIEHLTSDQSFFFASECLRILRNDGVLRLATPDLDKLFLVFFDRNPSVDLDIVLKRHFKTLRQTSLVSAPLATDLINDFFYLWGHKNLFNFASLKRLFSDVGFADISLVSYGESQFPSLRNLERHSDQDAYWTRDALNVIVEVTK